VLPIGIGGNTLAVYNLESSLRFRSSADAYLSRTLTSNSTSSTTMTFSWWHKYGGTNVDGNEAHYVYTSNTTDTKWFRIGLTGSANEPVLYAYYRDSSSVQQMQLRTNAIFRDPSAWYHFTIAIDTTQATASNRVKLYVNGVQQTSFSTADYPSQNYTFQGVISTSGNAVNIGRSFVNSTALHPFEGYITEYHHIDGQALTPSDFGSYDGTTGVWKPKEYTGTYGTNGFYLPFTGEITPTVTAGFGGTAENVLYDDTAYLVSNTTTGSGFDLVEYDFGESINMIDYNIQDLRFTGGVSTFRIYTSDDGSNYTERVALSVSSSYQNYTGNLGVTARYIKIRATNFGTNGQAYLNYFNVDVDSSVFSDNSGNVNNWTPNNINLITDIMNDVPTLTDEDTANFCTLNPLNKKSTLTLSDGNLKATGANASYNNAYSTFMIPKDVKTYFEVTVVNSLGGGNNLAFYLDSVIDWSRVGAPSGAYGVDFGVTSTYYTYLNGTSTNTGVSISNGHTVQMAIDQASGKMWIGVNNTWFSSGNPSAGTNSIATISTTTDYFIRALCYNSGSMAVNFGQRPFKYTPPTGFKKLNTYNLPDSTIADGSNYFNTITYTGDGTTGRDITGLEFSPDLVWIKDRTATYGHVLYDTIRGATVRLSSSSTGADITQSNSLTAFNSDGFSIDDWLAVNTNTNSYVAWNWRGSDSSAVSNTDGTITSTVSANTTSGFSVVTYTGNGTTTTVGHGLGITPKVLIMKNRDISQNWHLYTTALDGSWDYFNLNTTATKLDSGLSLPSSSVFSIGSTTSGLANDYVAYCFAEVEGFSKFGSYTGNGSTDGPFIYTGFRPAFVLWKNSSSTNGWFLMDSKRNTYNVTNTFLRPNASDAEANAANSIADYLSNGFKLRGVGGDVNGSGNTIIYMAFAENPFKQSLAR
jgi:hypothetical protein